MDLHESGFSASGEVDQQPHRQGARRRKKKVLQCALIYPAAEALSVCEAGAAAGLAAFLNTNYAQSIWLHIGERQHNVQIHSKYAAESS